MASDSACRLSPPPWRFSRVPDDDEQGVVDADAQADHRADDGRSRGHVEHARGEQHRAEPGADGDEREHYRDQRGDDRAEGEDEDDEGHDDAEELGVGRLVPGAVEGDIAAELGDDPGVTGGAERRGDAERGLLPDERDGSVEQHGRVADSAVGRDRSVGEGVADGNDAIDVPDDGEGGANGVAVVLEATTVRRREHGQRTAVGSVRERCRGSRTVGRQVVSADHHRW
jgi:hypothetical protein